MSASASIIIPTRERPGYLRVALASIVEQAQRAGAEVLVIDDAGASQERRALVEGTGARYEPHPRPLGLNAARNTGVQRSSAELVVFVDDDVEVAAGWLSALIDAALDHPRVNVFTGPIRPRLEGNPPRSCGREGAPITSLDLGELDTERVRYAWGANMALRRSAFRSIGAFDPCLQNGGDEQEWQDRLYAAGLGGVLYVAGAALYHRRSPADSRLRSLVSSAYARGRASRRFDSLSAEAPTVAQELWTLLGCVGHVLRYRCPAALTMVAHSQGRLREALGEGSPARGGHDPSPSSADVERPEPSSGAAHDDFLSGESGTVGGLDVIRRVLSDELTSTWRLASGQRRALHLAARDLPPQRRVLVLGVERPAHRAMFQKVRAELARSRHEVRIHTREPGELGKFENLNLLLAEHRPDAHDWLLIIDDDVALPRGFLDSLLFLAERFSFDLLQPAHRANSHAAWDITRRRAASVARETPFVEIGPVTALSRRTFPEMLPFPPLRMGWGLDLHWAALARERGWRCGVLDALAIGHTQAPAASSYSREAAVSEARAFLAEHPYLSAREAQQTLHTHRRW
jgi:GT2 family glycosyltransferase